MIKLLIVKFMISIKNLFNHTVTQPINKSDFFMKRVYMWINQQKQRYSITNKVTNQEIKMPDKFMLFFYFNNRQNKMTNFPCNNVQSYLIKVYWKIQNMQIPITIWVSCMNMAMVLPKILNKLIIFTKKLMNWDILHQPLGQEIFTMMVNFILRFDC